MMIVEVEMGNELLGKLGEHLKHLGVKNWESEAHNLMHIIAGGEAHLETPRNVGGVCGGF